MPLTGGSPELSVVVRRARRRSKALIENQLYMLNFLILARFPYFATFANGRGGMLRPPLRFETKRRRVAEKTADCSRRILAIGGAFLIVGKYLTQ